MGEPHTAEELEALETVAREASPGPWQNGIDDLEGVVAPNAPGLGNVICVPPTEEMYSSAERWPENARHIATFDPPTVLRLIDQLKAKGAESGEAVGWLYQNDDGPEWSESHPKESGEVPDARDIRPATAGELLAMLKATWAANSERVAHPPSPEPDQLKDGREVESLRRALVDAFIAGCEAVQEAHRLDPDQRFGEASLDYAASVDLGAITAALSPRSLEGVEEVARIIDPTAFKSHAAMVAYNLKAGEDQETAQRYADRVDGPYIEEALAKARTILQALSVKRVDRPELPSGDTASPDTMNQAQLRDEVWFWREETTAELFHLRRAVEATTARSKAGQEARQRLRGAVQQLSEALSGDVLDDCFACALPIRPGDAVITDVNEGEMHAQCPKPGRPQTIMPGDKVFLDPESIVIDDDHPEGGDPALKPDHIVAHEAARLFTAEQISQRLAEARALLEADRG